VGAGEESKQVFPTLWNLHHLCEVQLETASKCPPQSEFAIVGNVVPKTTTHDLSPLSNAVPNRGAISLQIALSS
jgi:hypothetical protein